MGNCYSFVNHDKQQFFHVGLFSYNSRLAAIGEGPGVRALAILLNPQEKTHLGRASAHPTRQPDIANLLINTDNRNQSVT